MAEYQFSFQKIELYAHDNQQYKDSEKRKMAVEAALELIRAECLGRSGSTLDSNLDNLSQYADKIQAALKTK